MRKKNATQEKISTAKRQRTELISHAEMEIYGRKDDDRNCWISGNRRRQVVSGREINQTRILMNEERRRSTLARASEPRSRLKEKRKKTRQRSFAQANVCLEPVETLVKRTQEEIGHDPDQLEVYETNYRNWSQALENALTMAKYRGIASYEGEGEEGEEDKEAKSQTSEGSPPEPGSESDEDGDRMFRQVSIFRYLKPKPAISRERVKLQYKRFWHTFVQEAKTPVITPFDLEEVEQKLRNLLTLESTSAHDGGGFFTDPPKGTAPIDKCPHCRQTMVVDGKTGEESCTDCGITRRGASAMRPSFTQLRSTSRPTAPYARIAHVSIRG